MKTDKICVCTICNVEKIGGNTYLQQTPSKPYNISCVLPQQNSCNFGTNFKDVGNIKKSRKILSCAIAPNIPISPIRHSQF